MQAANAGVKAAASATSSASSSWAPQPAAKMPPRRPTTVLLVGTMGAGKSTAGNAICGKHAFKAGGGFASVTHQLQRCRRSLDVAEGYQSSTPATPSSSSSLFDIPRMPSPRGSSPQPLGDIQLIDSVGFFDTQEGQADAGSYALEALADVAPDGIDVVALVQPYGRMSRETLAVVKRLEDAFGADELKMRGLVIVSMCDDLAEDRVDEWPSLATGGAIASPVTARGGWGSGAVATDIGAPVESEEETPALRASIRARSQRDARVLDELRANAESNPVSRAVLELGSGWGAEAEAAGSQRLVSFAPATHQRDVARVATMAQRVREAAGDAPFTSAQFDAARVLQQRVERRKTMFAGPRRREAELLLERCHGGLITVGELSHEMNRLEADHFAELKCQLEQRAAVQGLLKEVKSIGGVTRNW